VWSRDFSGDDGTRTPRPLACKLGRALAHGPSPRPKEAYYALSMAVWRMAGMGERGTISALAAIAAVTVVAVGSGAAIAIAVLSGGRSASLPTATGPFPCASPNMLRSGAPAIAVILLDGVPSQGDGGIYYPVPVDDRRSGVPTVTNYCPLNASYAERRAPDLPSGLDDSLRRWSEFSSPGSSSGGGSSTPTTSDACHRLTSQPQNANPSPTPVGPAKSSGFGQGHCLTESLADAGAVLVPYSYKGVVLTHDGELTVHSYSADDSRQALCSSVEALGKEISSIHQSWPTTRVYLIGHSYGGLVAETWWYGENQMNGGDCRIATGAQGVSHVFSLDSPINGVERCALATIAPGGPGNAASTWCDLWGGDSDHGVSNGKRIAAIDDRTLTYTAVGTPNDPTFEGGLSTGGDGGLNDQLVYDCSDSAGQDDPSSKCIDTTGGSLPVSYPVTSAKCDGADGDIDGTTGHDLVKACPDVIKLIISSFSRHPTSGPASFAPFVASWYVHAGELVFNADGTFSISERAYQFCPGSPGYDPSLPYDPNLPCDSQTPDGSSIDGYNARGVLDSVRGDTAIGHIIGGSGFLVGPVTFVYDPSTDIVTGPASEGNMPGTFCGPNAAGGACGA
jgi:hypothetical protein